MAAETTGSRQRRLLNSPATGGADSGVRGAAKGAADPVPARAATSGGLKARVKSGRKRGAWTAAEDAELRAYVAKYGAGNWKHVADAMALKRDAQSCRLRWSSCLNPKVNRAPFTPEEDARLLASVAWGSHGETKWAAIASAKLPWRNGYQIQSRWHSLVKKQRWWIHPPAGSGSLRGGLRTSPQRGGLSESELLAQHSLVNKQRRWINPPAGGGCPGGALPPKGGDEGRGELPPPLEGGGEGYEIQSCWHSPAS
ncbi:unnamed protein product [Closterium sp. NIES-64]|nr:unnamed protein product [Closterium sp. NIES-64]